MGGGRDGIGGRRRVSQTFMVKTLFEPLSGGPASFVTLGDDDALREVARVRIGRHSIKVRRIVGASRNRLRWRKDVVRVRTRSSTRRVDRQVIAPSNREGSDHPISQDNIARSVGDVPAVGRIADTSLSQCGD